MPHCSLGRTETLVSRKNRNSEDENKTAYATIHDDGAFDEDAGGSQTNHGYVKAARNSYTTYINAEIVIWYVATGGSWTRHYGLYGYDTWDREFTITGCECPRFVYTAKVASTVTAKAQLTGEVETGDVYARASGMLKFEVDGVVVGQSDKECLAGTKDLDNINTPEIADGSYSYPIPGGEKHGLAAHYETEGDPAVAEQTMSIFVPAATKNGGKLNLNIRSWAMVKVRVPSNYGWGHASVKHKFYTTDFATNDDWEVKVEAWDDDDPDNPIRIKAELYFWTKWGD